MFENFANVWTMVGLARSVTRNKPLPMQVAGERIVFFRDAQGKAAALLDRCPHRGAALSLGKVRDGMIDCPFHGWRFAGSSENCAVPWNPEAKLSMLHAIALPVRETGGLLWLYTGFAPQSEPMTTETLDQTGLSLSEQSVVWGVHWSRVMENMLDMPHVPFVHRGTIGKQLSRLTDRRMDVFWEERAYGGRITNKVDGAARPGMLDYRFPNTMELFIDPPARTFRLMATCIPMDDTHTRLSLYTMRSFLRAPLFDPLFAWMNRRIAAEDKAIVESSLPQAVPPPGEECSVRTDAPTLAFRRIYRQRLLGSKVDAPARISA